MATTQAKVNPKKKSSGFQGVKNAFFIILVSVSYTHLHRHLWQI